MTAEQLFYGVYWQLGTGKTANQLRAAFAALSDVNWMPPASTARLLGGAAWQNDALAADILLSEFGADVNARDRDGWTPLMIAALQGRCEIVKLLLLHGADRSAASTKTFTAKFPLGTTAMDIAIGRSDVEALLATSPPPPAPPAPPLRLIQTVKNL